MDNLHVYRYWSDMKGFPWHQEVAGPSRGGAMPLMGAPVEAFSSLVHTSPAGFILRELFYGDDEGLREILEAVALDGMPWKKVLLLGLLLVSWVWFF